jgi:hypothetical protein
MARSKTNPADCACSTDQRTPKGNGTCAACGGWLPGEREKGPNLVELFGGGGSGGSGDETSDAYWITKCDTCKHQRIDHILHAGCLKSGCVCMKFRAGI